MHIICFFIQICYDYNKYEYKLHIFFLNSRYFVN